MAANSGNVIQVDVDALSGAVSTAITQAIRQHSNATSTGNATPITQGTGQLQSNAAQNQSGDGQASASAGRKRRYSVHVDILFCSSISYDRRSDLEL